VIEDLLDLADELAVKDQNRPKQASLRRAAATAYYAVFHALAKLCADQLVGTTRPWDAYTPVYRALDHGAARQVLNEMRKDATSGHLVAPIGLVFAKLNDVRIAADYVPQPFAYSRQEVKDLIREARDAIQAVNALPTELKLRLAVQFVTKKR